MSQKRKKSYRSGLRAERLASWLLWFKGYRLLERRYKTPVGELDLVVCRGQRIVFVEVKARPDHQAALLAVTPKQQRRIHRAASYWLASKRGQIWQQRLAARGRKFWRGGEGAEFCFDVIAVAPRSLPRHVKNAFANHLAN